MSHIHHLTFLTLSLFSENYNFMFSSDRVAEIIALYFL